MENLVQSETIPTLSICIPAYRHEEGVRLILSRLEYSDRLEVLISEDKSEKPLHLDEFQDQVRFEHTINERPSGPVANWNGVISRARGKYIWLLHHDEEPFFINGLGDLLKTLEQDEQRDCLVSHLNINDRWWQRLLRSDVVRKLLVRFPKSVLLQNYIGSPSNVIFHQSKYAEFDETLQWFVDTEWYYRLFSRCTRISFSEFGIITHPYVESITQELKNKVGELSQMETKYICQKHSFTSLTKRVLLTKLTLGHILKKGFGS